MSDEVESAEFYAQRLVVRLWDIDGDELEEKRIADELRARDAAVAKAAAEKAELKLKIVRFRLQSLCERLEHNAATVSDTLSLIEDARAAGDMP